ncbi:MAG TPA: HAD family hydrolase [Acidobacteriota bacterium]|jgi:phosphoglycolate phosphatase
MQSELNTIVFDLDGTLLDTESIVLDAVSKAVDRTSGKFRLDLRQPARDEILALLGIPVFQFVSRLGLNLKEEAAKYLESEIEEEELQLIEDGQARLFDGVSDVLRQLKACDWNLALISNCSRRYLMALSDYFDFGNYFEFSLCVEDVRLDGKGILLRELLTKTDRLAAETIYVGDRTSDWEAANFVKCGFIGARWGYGGGFDAQIVTIGSIRELPEILKRIEESHPEPGKSGVKC